MSHSHDGTRNAGHAVAWRVQLAEHMSEERARLADAMFARLRNVSNDGQNTLIARTLVTVVAKAIETGDPDAVTQWAQTVRVSHEDQTVVNLIGAACDVTIDLAQSLDHMDVTALLVFLEILREHAREALLEGKLPSRAEATNRVVIETVLALLKARDEATCTHSQATGYWCRRLCEGLALGPALTERVVRAGMLHDIGKIGTPDRVLLKPGPLNSEEWAVMQQHAVYGYEVLSEIPALQPYARIIRAHHERFDGTGYPDGLCATEIPFEARVVAVADAFHAMVSDRPYRAALSYGEAIAILTSGRGSQWDAQIVDVMIRIAAAERNRSAEAGLAAITESLAPPVRRVSQQAG